MIEEIVGTCGVILITVILVKIIHFFFRMQLIYLAAELSRSIQGIETMPKPPLRNLVNLVQFLITKKAEIEKQLDKDESYDKYDNTYR